MGLGEAAHSLLPDYLRDDLQGGDLILLGPVVLFRHLRGFVTEPQRAASSRSFEVDDSPGNPLAVATSLLVKQRLVFNQQRLVFFGGQRVLAAERWDVGAGG
jgi:hypothetical protein